MIHKILNIQEQIQEQIQESLLDSLIPAVIPGAIDVIWSSFGPLRVQNISKCHPLP